MKLWNWLITKIKSPRTHTPALARTLLRLLPKLDQPRPDLTGHNPEARKKLNNWRSSEANLRRIIDQLASAGDPTVARACWLLATTVRYQSGRRDDTLAAYVDALYYDRDNAELWHELLDYAAAAPYIPMLVELFKRMPRHVRPDLLGYFVAISDGRDRMGNLDPDHGHDLREALLLKAQAEGDLASVALLAGEEGRRAEQAGDLDSAVRFWRTATQAGSTDAAVADRFTIWLVQQGQYAEAAQVLRQALTTPPKSATVRQRLEKRLARCEKALN
ncbi:hypothetical protein [Thermoactinospora rubra]|uniref:hypothetical protein n=1 Tax=Thermoactinospora rubra TaxID=1088767 RepID=UPI000A10F604|nr:hypothetical protein [Thermoactinospora rubra]